MMNGFSGTHLFPFNADWIRTMATATETTMTDAERIEKLTELVTLLLDNSVPSEDVTIETLIRVVELGDELGI